MFYIMYLFYLVACISEVHSRDVADELAISSCANLPEITDDPNFRNSSGRVTKIYVTGCLKLNKALCFARPGSSLTVQVDIMPSKDSGDPGLTYNRVYHNFGGVRTAHIERLCRDEIRSHHMCTFRRGRSTTIQQSFAISTFPPQTDMIFEWHVKATRQSLFGDMWLNRNDEDVFCILIPIVFVA